MVKLIGYNHLVVFSVIVLMYDQKGQKWQNIVNACTNVTAYMAA